MPKAARPEMRISLQGGDMNKWTGLVRACGMAASGVFFMAGIVQAAEAAEQHGIVIGQRHFDAYCVYLLSQQARAEESDCTRRDGRTLMVKTAGTSADCNTRGVFKRKPASRTRYTLRYARP
jgi:hypothetical protein